MVRARRSVTQLQQFLYDNRDILNLPQQPATRQRYRVNPGQPFRPPLTVPIYPGVFAVFTPLVDASIAEYIRQQRFQDIDRSALLRIVVRLTVSPNVNIDADDEEEQMAIAQGLLTALRNHFPVSERRTRPPEVRYTAFAFNTQGEARVRQHDQGLSHFVSFDHLTPAHLRMLWSNQLYPDFDMTNTLHIFEIRLRDLRRFRQGGEGKAPHLFPRKSKSNILGHFFTRLSNNACEKQHCRLIQEECPPYLSHSRGIFSLNMEGQYCGVLAFMVGLYYAKSRNGESETSRIEAELGIQDLVKACLADPGCLSPAHPIGQFAGACGTMMPTVLDDFGKWVINLDNGIYRVVVYDEFCRCLYECRGEKWKPRDGLLPDKRHWTETFHNSIVIMLDSTAQHFYSVIHLSVFFHHFLLKKLLEHTVDNERLTDIQKEKLESNYLCIPFCGYCHRHVISRWRTHACSYILCHRCHQSFLSEEALNEHMTQEAHICRFCHELCYGDDCIALHQQHGCLKAKPYSYCFNCRRWYLDPKFNQANPNLSLPQQHYKYQHFNNKHGPRGNGGNYSRPRYVSKTVIKPHYCFTRKCTACKRYDINPKPLFIEGYGNDQQYHDCPIIPLQPESLNPLFEETPMASLSDEALRSFVNNRGEAYFAYDMESMLVRLPCRLWDTQKTDLFYHEPNLIVVQQLFVPNRRWVFESDLGSNAMDKFYMFITSLPYSARFFAHNSKGYDGRIVYDYLMKQRHYFKNIIWSGAKLMMLQIYRDKQLQQKYWKENADYVTIPSIADTDNAENDGTGGHQKKKGRKKRKVGVSVSLTGKKKKKRSDRIQAPVSNDSCHFKNTYILHEAEADSDFEDDYDNDEEEEEEEDNDDFQDDRDDSNDRKDKPVIITFADSLCHFQQPLSKLPKMFGLHTNLRKGFFPYHFNVPEYQGYRGPIPDLSYFDLEFKTEKTLHDLLEWHASWEGKEWVLRDEMIAYGINDVVILAEALESYYRVCVKDYEIDPLQSLTVASYCFKVFRTYHLQDRTLYNLSLPHEAFARRALHGGRTDVRQRYLALSDSDIAAGYRIEYIDVQSLYPFVQTAFDYPIGLPVTTLYSESDQPHPQYLQSFMGFIECDIEPTLPLFHPYLLSKQDGKLLAHLYPQKQVVLTSLEFQRATLYYGYKCTRVYRIDQYERSPDLFKSYIYANLKRKILAGKCPVSEDAFPEYARELEQLYGYKGLKYSDFQPDDARKIAAKVRLNSNWGRLAMRQHFPNCRVLTTVGERVDFFRAQNHFNWTIKDHLTLGDQSTIVNYVSHKATKGINVAAAAFVTAAGHCVLYDMACQLGFRVLYCDTDSLVYLHRPGWFQPPIGNKLGDWENELPPDDFIQEFVALAPKTYAYQTRKGKFVYHAKGINSNATADAAFTLANMRETVMGAQGKLVAKALHFMYSRKDDEGIRSTVIQKHVKGDYQKGLIGAEYRTFPYGYAELYQRYFNLPHPINVTKAVPWEEDWNDKLSQNVLPLWEPLQRYPLTYSSDTVLNHVQKIYYHSSMETNYLGTTPPQQTSTTDEFDHEELEVIQWLASNAS